MNSRVMDKFNELIGKGVLKERELEAEGNGEVTLDNVWLSLLVAQSEIIVLLDDIKKIMSEYKSSRFERLDIT